MVAALEAGADDYVSKPFVVEELEAQLKALLRRPTMVDSNTDPADVVVLDSQIGLVLDRGAAVLSRAETQVHLTHTEFRLLSVLIDHVGRVLSREILLDQVWDHSFHGDERLVDVHVRRLRKKIEPDPSSPTTLVTVRGLGYRLDTR